MDCVGFGEVAVTGQMVVEIASVFVVTEPRGQFVTDAGHLEIVYTMVV